MIRLICNNCEKYNYVRNVSEFNKCDCGCDLTVAIKELIKDADYTLSEARMKMYNHASSNLCNNFTIDIF